MAELAGLTYDIPLTMPFRGITRRQGMLLRGPAGWAEWSPFPEYGDEEAASWLAAALEAATAPPPSPVRDTVPVNAIVPAVPPAEAAERVRLAGCTTAKVKVAQTGQVLDDDIARAAAVREVLGPHGRMRVDANGAWSVQEAETAIRELAPLGLEYVEQPCATVPELADLRRRLDGLVPIAADESIRRADDPYRVVSADAADVAVLKVQPLGGVRRCLRLAEELGLPVVVSSAVETSIGLWGGVALAAALPELPFACGLETLSLLSDDVSVPGLRVQAGELAVVRPEVEETALDRCRADADVAGWWLSRLERVAGLVAGWPGMEEL